MTDPTDPTDARPKISLPAGERPHGKSSKYKKRRGPPPLVIRKERAPREQTAGEGRARDDRPREGRFNRDKPGGYRSDRTPREGGWKPRPPRDGKPNDSRARDDRPREGRSRDDRPREGHVNRDKPRGGYRSDRGPRQDGWKPRPPRDGKPHEGRSRDDRPREGRVERDKPRGGYRSDRGPRQDGWQSRPPRHDRPRDDKPRHDTPREDRATADPSNDAPRSTRPAGADKLLRICGLNAVQSLHAAAPERIVRLFYTDEKRHHVGAVAKSMAELRKPYRQVEEAELAKIAGTVLHGGVVALAEPKPIPPLDMAAARAWAEAGEPLLILDGVGNPHNVGAIARTAAFFGVKRIVLSAQPTQAGLSDAAYRVAQGGLDVIETFRAGDLAAALAELQGAYRIVGTALDGAVALAELARDARPIALVLGNEEEGVPAATLALCESVVRIPGAGPVQSLNVAATAAILVHGLLAHGV